MNFFYPLMQNTKNLIKHNEAIYLIIMITLIIGGVIIFPILITKISPSLIFN